MTFNVREVLNKLVGPGMLSGSFVFFTDSSPAAFVPGILFGAAGFWLMIRRDRQPVKELELEHRVDELAEGLTAMQADVVAVLQHVDRLTTERDFARQLAGGSAQALPVTAGPDSAPGR